MQVYENAITLNNSGSVGYCFYHQYKFVCSDHCTVITIKDSSVPLNTQIALFLRPIIESMKNKFNFAREINNSRLNKEKILLPKNEKGVPDWKFMEHYINEVARSIVFNRPVRIKGEKVLIDTSSWKWFNINDLFEIEKGERLVETERIEGELPLITAASKENGVVDFLSEDTFRGKKKIFENKLTIDMFFNVFCHTYKYFSDDNVHTLIPKFNNDNFYIKLFILTVLRESRYKYAYGRQLRIKRLELEKVKLPIDKKGNPDWQFMEDYIKSLPYSSNL